MDEYKEVQDVIEVPKNAGLDGFLHTIRTYLRKPRVQEIVIDARGKVTVRRYVRADDSDRNVGIDFGELQPSGIVRNSHVEEVTVLGGASAAVAIGGLLDMVAVAQFKPTAFMTGPATALWDWYRVTTGVALRNREQLHGLPLLLDRQIPDTALILTMGYGRDAALVDTRQALKIEIPTYSLPDTTVEVI
jgi:hypothetical protein